MHADQVAQPTFFRHALGRKPRSVREHIREQQQKPFRIDGTERAAGIVSLDLQVDRSCAGDCTTGRPLARRSPVPERRKAEAKKGK